MTIEQYLKAMLGELQMALAATMAERDALKEKVAGLEAALKKSAIKKEKE